MKVADSTTQDYEAELVERIRLGDGTAKEEFYNIYKGRLYSLIFDKVGRDPAMAEDLVQEIFLAALGSLDKFHGDSQLYTWLCSIAYHKISDFYRGRARETKLEKLPLDTDAAEPEWFRDTAPTIPSVMESEEARHAILQALAELSQDYRQVLILKYIDEMPVLEISQVMARSPKSVEGLLSRARKTLRSNLVGAGKSD